jgi:chemotaxis protein histidine kinase CheA
VDEKAPASLPIKAGQYFKAAFLNHWNMLGLVGVGGAALLAGIALLPVTVPLVAAGELLTVFLLGAHPKFRKYVDAQNATVQRKAGAQTSHQTLNQILQALPPTVLARFQKLQARCLELRQIASDLKRTSGEGEELPFDSMQLEGLDKLLWIFLRLLFTQFALGRFLERTNKQKMQADVQQVEARLQEIDPQDQSVHGQKMRRTLEDHLQTCRDRLANYQKAEANYELVGLEIDRLENKINTLAEMAINRQEPDFIAGQVDQVAGSMLEMEKTMNDLQFATGLAPVDEDVPTLMQTPPVQVKA